MSIFIVVVFLSVSWIQSIQAQNSSDFADQIASINEMTDRSHLVAMLDKKDVHINNAVKIRLLLLEPDIVELYGNLEFTYEHGTIKNTYHASWSNKSCTLNVEVVTVKIVTALSGNTVGVYSFSEAADETENFTVDSEGRCQTKTYKAHVFIEQIRDKLINNPSGRYTLMVTSELPGVEVFFNNIHKGITPLQIKGLEKRWYPIRLEKTGYKTLESGVGVNEDTSRHYKLEEVDVKE